MKDLTELQVALADVEVGIQEEANARIAAVRRYAKWLANNGDPTVIGGWGVPEEFVKAQTYADPLVRAWRADNGMPPNPASAIEGRRYQALDLLLEAKEKGEFVMASELQKLLRGQVESKLRPWTFDADGLKLEKISVDGRVAYQLVSTDEVRAALEQAEAEGKLDGLGGPLGPLTGPDDPDHPVQQVLKDRLS